MALYENIGNHDVRGHAPGEVFEDDLDPVTEARLIGGGHLKRVSATDRASFGAASSSTSLAALPKSASSTPTNGLDQKNVRGDADTPDADDDVAA